MLSYLKKLKLKLQFTGWLQYLLPTVVSIIFLIIGTLFWFLNLSPVTYVFYTLGFVLLTITIFDVLTVKFGLRPSERIPARRDGMDAFDLMRARTACRSFQNRKLTESDKNELLRVAQNVNNEQSDFIGENEIRFEYINARLTVWPVVGA